MNPIHQVVQFMVSEGGPRLRETLQEPHQGLDAGGQHVVVVIKKDEHIAARALRAPVPGGRRGPPLGTVTTCTSG